MSVMRLEPLGAGGQPGGVAAGNNPMVPLPPELRKGKPASILHRRNCMNRT